MMPAHEPDEVKRTFVRSLSAVGMPYEDIALKLKISADTLTKYYKSELQLGRSEANAEIARTLYQQAKSGNTAAMIFWLKTRAKWKEVHHHEHTGEDGAPIISKIELVVVDNASD